MYKIKNLFLLILISVFLFNSCGRSVNYKNRYTHRNHYKSSYNMPMQPARNMNELDMQSRNVKPHYVYTYPKSIRDGHINLVDLSAVKYRMLNYINNIRAMGNRCGPPAPPLAWNKKLEEAAIAHTQDMASKNFLSHIGSGTDTDPARKAPGVGSNFYERIIYYGYPIKPGELAGEILTYTKFRIVGNQKPYENFLHAVDNFLKSPKHCALLMNPRFHDIGVAAYKDREKMYWAIEFAETNY